MTTAFNVTHYHDSDIEMMQGIYLGGEHSSKGYLKWLRLQQGSDEYEVKLPKLIGHTVSKNLRPGMPIQVWARSKKDTLKAMMVIPMPPDALDDPTAAASAKTDSEAGITDALAIANPLVKVAYYSPTAPTSTPDAKPPASNPSSPKASATQRCVLQVCGKGSCRKRGGRSVVEALESAIREQNLEHVVTLETTGCLKNCKKGPTVKATDSSQQSKSVKYSYVQAKDVPQLLQRFGQSYQSAPGQHR